MTIAHLPAPTWSPRLPPITVDCRDELARIVMADGATPAARTSAAAWLDGTNASFGIGDFWSLEADRWNAHFDGAA